MEKIKQKILDSLKELVESESLIEVLETSKVHEENYYLLNPQIEIKLFLNRKIEIIATVKSNGDNGFTEFKKTYPLKMDY